jgi:hypothetical protein
MDMLHGVYLAEHLLGAPAEAVSAFVDSAADGDAVEGLALCRLETGRRAALVNVGWGLGPGGVAVHGTKGRAIARYRAEGTMPWAPFEQLTVTTADGTRTVGPPPGQELGPLVADAMRDTVVDLADAIARGRPPPTAPPPSTPWRPLSPPTRPRRYAAPSPCPCQPTGRCTAPAPPACAPSTSRNPPSSAAAACSA